MSLRSPRRQALVAALLLMLALGLRLGEVARTSYRPVGDATAYLTLASQIAHSGDYRNSHAPGSGAGGSRGPTAYFPPAFPYLLAAVDLIDGHATPADGAVEPARIAGAVLGTLTAGFVGLVGLEAFGEVVALIALALAAVYPVFVELAGVVVAENLMTLLVLAATWAALRARRSAHPHGWIALAGILTGLATLSHVNSIVLLLPLGIAAWRLFSPTTGWSPTTTGPPAATTGPPATTGGPPATTAGPPATTAGPATTTGLTATTTGPQPRAARPWARRRRAGPLAWRPAQQAAASALLVASTLLTLAPWVVRDAIELHRFVPVTDEGGVTLVGTYNRASAANPHVPYQWMIFARIPGEPPQIRHPAELAEPTLSARLEHQALHYIARHPTAPVAVLYHNTRRLLELEGATAWRFSAASIGLPLGTARIGVASFWLLALLALGGLFTRAFRRAPAWLWLVPVLLWLTVALVNGETPRFREPIDPFLILAASCALSTLLARAIGRRRELNRGRSGSVRLAAPAGPGAPR